MKTKHSPIDELDSGNKPPIALGGKSIGYDLDALHIREAFGRSELKAEMNGVAVVAAKPSSGRIGHEGDAVAVPSHADHGGLCGVPARRLPAAPKRHCRCQAVSVRRRKRS